MKNEIKNKHMSFDERIEIQMTDNTTLVSNKTTSTEMIAGHPNWCHRVEEWSVPVSIKDLTNTYIGASAVQGRKIYGIKISKADAVIVKRKEV